MAGANAALERLLEEARQDPDVAGVIQFGSSLEREDPGDLDVAVVLRRQPGKDRFELTLKYHAFAQPEERGGLDVSVFQALPLYIRHRVLRDGHVLLAGDEDELYDVAWETVKAWEDFRPFYEDYLEAVARG